MLFLVDGARPAGWDGVGGYARVVLLFDGGSAETLEAARAAWKLAKAAGHDATYWKESPSGKFEKQG